MIKSQDDMQNQSRENEVLLKAIESAQFWYDQAKQANQKLDKIRSIVTNKRRSYESKTIAIYDIVKELD